MSEQKNFKEFSILGTGQMGGAIARCALKNGYHVSAFDRNPKNQLESHKNLTQFKSFDELLSFKKPLFLAIKPNQALEILNKILDNRLIISIAAGLSHTQIKKYRGKPGNVIRVMPNTPIKAGEGMTVLFSNDASTEELKFVHDLFSGLGLVHCIQDESWMNSITGVSGSGPAFVYLFMQAMEDAGVRQGLPRELSRKLVTQTLIGASKLVKNENKSPQELIHEVTSPGGTTIAGIEALKKGSFESKIWEAISMATNRSIELEAKIF